MSNGIKSSLRLTKPGDTEALRRVMWLALRRVQGILQHPETDQESILKAASTVATLGGAYSNVTKTHALESELNELQRAFNEFRATISRPASADERSKSSQTN